jgi:hypothetical protein
MLGLTSLERNRTKEIPTGRVQKPSAVRAQRSWLLTQPRHVPSRPLLHQRCALLADWRKMFKQDHFKERCPELYFLASVLPSLAGAA